MLKHLSLRIITMIPQVVVMTIIIFIVSNSTVFRLGTSEEQLLHLTRSVQDYFYWIGNFLQGDWGRSTRFLIPVNELLQWRLSNSIFLSLLALVMMYLLAIPAALVSAKNQGKIREHIVTAFASMGFALPMFLFTLLAMYIFVFRLGWFPSGGSRPPGMTAQHAGYGFARFRHMVLPAFCIAIVNMAPVFHYLKAEMVQLAEHPMVITAQSKGCSKGRIYHKHIFRNSLFPVTTSFGYQLATLMGSAIFAEMLFMFPGMGELLLTAFRDRDQAVIAGIILLYSLATIIGSCLSELMTAWVDPRIRVK